MSRGRFELERVFDAPIAQVWDLWTTREGIESWWGPDGFTTKVLDLDVRRGGVWRYAMTATGPEQVAFMQQAGLPLTTESRAKYREVKPRALLAYKQVADFVPGIDPYDVETSVAFTQEAGGVRMTVAVDAMHDMEWTRRARAGWESQLERLSRRMH